jgi:hypothetical protein
MADWTWIESKRVYRDMETGAELDAREQRRIADEWMAKKAPDLGTTMRSLIGRDAATIKATFGEAVADVLASSYAIGRGGLNMMDEADWSDISILSDAQAGYLDGFIADMADLTDDQIAARAEGYAGSGSLAFSAGVAKAAGDLDLPALPGDGDTECGANCNCWWDIEETEDGYEATWQLGASAVHCEDCLHNADEWSPLSFDADGNRVG